MLKVPPRRLSGLNPAALLSLEPDPEPGAALLLEEPNCCCRLDKPDRPRLAVHVNEPLNWGALAEKTSVRTCLTLVGARPEGTDALLSAGRPAPNAITPATTTGTPYRTDFLRLNATLPAYRHGRLSRASWPCRCRLRPPPQAKVRVRPNRQVAPPSIGPRPGAAGPAPV